MTSASKITPSWVYVSSVAGKILFRSHSDAVKDDGVAESREGERRVRKRISLRDGGAGSNVKADDVGETGWRSGATNRAVVARNVAVE